LIANLAIEHESKIETLKNTSCWWLFFPDIDSLMADIFDEIDEDLKRDRMQVLWARYGKILIAAVAAIVLLVGARQGFKAWQSNKSEASAAAFQQALKGNDIVSALEARYGQLTIGYAMLAQFQIAVEQVAIDNFEAAEATYLRLASDTSLDPIYQQAAVLLSVMVAPKDGDLAPLLARLVNLETTVGPWQAMALETSAGLSLRAGDRNSAVAKYQRLIEMADVPDGMRQRANRMAAMLSD
jgi:hypothetical protein